jgi:hypothetical protein
MVCASFPSGPYQWPMGAEGPLLPLIILGITLTSIRLGFGAAGAQGSGTAPASAAGDWVGECCDASGCCLCADHSWMWSVCSILIIIAPAFHVAPHEHMQGGLCVFCPL